MDARPETLARLLLPHFDASSRDMPWRRTADPYAIWVSEVMLQQTRVDAVIPFYERWLSLFPTVAALADADEEHVLRAWEGLGYYSRARNLHAAARVVRERHNGRVPDTATALRELPGIGAYTAGAISSIAYGRAEPAVDGNARRVFARLFDLDAPTFPELQRIVQPFIPSDRPGDFNQAVMELGSRICTPLRPRCGECPLQPHCMAFAHHTVALRPGSTPQKKVPQFDVAVVVLIARAGRLKRTLLVQRPATGLLAGFWQFPQQTCAVSRVRRVARELAAHFLTDAPPRARRLEPVRHVFSHRVETYHPFVFNLEYAAWKHLPTDSVCDVPPRWLDPAALHELPVSVAQRRVASAAAF